MGTEEETTTNEQDIDHQDKYNTSHDREYSDDQDDKDEVYNQCSDKSDQHVTLPEPCDRIDI